MVLLNYQQRNVAWTSAVATLYPVHAMGIGEDTEYFVSLDSPSAYRMQLLHHNLQKTYGLPHGTWVDANPHRSHAPGWQAHLANDGAICRGATEADVLAYYDESEHMQLRPRALWRSGSSDGPGHHACCDAR